MSPFPAIFRFGDVPTSLNKIKGQAGRSTCYESRIGFPFSRDSRSVPEREAISPPSLPAEIQANLASAALSQARAVSAGRLLHTVIVESEDLSRETIERLCRYEFGQHLQVDGFAQDGNEALRMISVLQPDLLIIDLQLAHYDGFAVIEHAREIRPGTKIIILTAASTPYTLYRIERLGVDAYIDKNDHATEGLRTALREVAGGRRYFGRKLLKEKQRRLADPVSFDKLLTDREREVLGLIGHGLSNEEIGALLVITAKTAETFRHRLLKKLGLAGTPKLIRFAIDQGFTQFALSAHTGKRVVRDFAPAATPPSTPHTAVERWSTTPFPSSPVSRPLSPAFR